MNWKNYNDSDCLPDGPREFKDLFVPSTPSQRRQEAQNERQVTDCSDCTGCEERRRCELTR